MVTHQTHDGGEKGQTDSAYKLTRLKFPNTLAGKSVLDIGCNEGYFCNQALKRDAERVVGIDMNEKFLDRARGFYEDPRLTFMHQGWDTLPEGPFDLMLWTSAMHYELDPLKVLKVIASQLAVNGTFILECGVLIAPRKEMLYSLRHDGGLWYPTLPLLQDMLAKAGMTYRIVSQAELVGTDPVPRMVFHCTRKVPSVMMLTGPSGAGKTTLAAQLYDTATKTISLDHFVARIAHSKWAHTPLEKYLTEKVKAANLSLTYDGIDEEGLTEDYIHLLCKGIANTDDLVVLEGYMTDKQRALMSEKLKNRARVWSVEKA